jgi:integrase
MAKLRLQRSRQAEAKIAAAPLWQDHGLIFTSEVGTPMHVVSEILGHASITITKDVYGHLLEGDKRAAATSMSRALFGT